MRTVHSWGVLALYAFLSAACGSDNPSNPPATTNAVSSATGGAAGATNTSSGAGGDTGSSDTTAGAGGSATGGAAGQNTGGGGGMAMPEGGPGGCHAPSVAGTAARSSEGVLTNYPAFHFLKSKGDFEITSIYFKLQKLPSFNSIQVWGDLKNTGTSQLCIPLVDTFNVGSQDVLVVVDGDAYKDTGTVSDTCLEPGGKALFKGIQNQVSGTLLDSPTTVTYAVSGFSSGILAIPHPSDPLLVSAAPKQSSLGWVLGGKMKAVNTIYNLKVGIYVRDPNGLLYDDTDAFPNDLNTIYALTDFDFESYPVDNQFCDYERFETFIEGPKPLAYGGANLDPVLEGRSLERASRVEAFSSAKKALRAAR
jgi:hypothetical protein